MLPLDRWYTFERGVHKTGGGEGWADVYKAHFAWEYKRKRRLRRAGSQSQVIATNF
jgi:hypothetical protein